MATRRCETNQNGPRRRSEECRGGPRKVAREALFLRLELGLGRDSHQVPNTSGYTSPGLTRPSWANPTHRVRHCSQSGKTLPGPTRTQRPNPTQICASPVCRPRSGRRTGEHFLFLQGGVNSAAASQRSTWIRPSSGICRCNAGAATVQRKTDMNRSSVQQPCNAKQQRNLHVEKLEIC